MNEFSKKTVEDLKKEMREKREATRAFRFGIAGSKLKNVKEGKNLKKDVARIHTEIRAKRVQK